MDIQDEEFKVSKLIVIFKFVSGAIELLLGLGIIFWGNKAFEIYSNFRKVELLEDPHDLLIRFTQSFIPSLFDHKTFVVIFLIALGIIKITGAIGLLYKKSWGVDMLLGLTLILLPFQFIDFLRKPSLLNFLYFAVGVFIAFWLVNFKPRQYIRKIRKRIKH